VFYSKIGGRSEEKRKILLGAGKIRGSFQFIIELEKLLEYMAVYNIFLPDDSNFLTVLTIGT